MPTSLKSTDDRLHPPGSAVDWRESYYFNFHDAAGRAGLTYISMSPHQGKVDRMIMILLPEDKGTLVCTQQDPMPRFEDAVLEGDVLKYHCLAPLQRWRLQAEGNFLSVPAGHAEHQPGHGAEPGQHPPGGEGDARLERTGPPPDRDRGAVPTVNTYAELCAV